MQIEEYFEAFSWSKSLEKELSQNQIGKCLLPIEEITNADIALISVEEDRGAVDNLGAIEGAEKVREYLYQLHKPNHDIKIIDLGSIKAGNTQNDTYFALKESVTFLIRQNILPIILGGSQDLTYATYLAYAQLEQTANLVSIDSKFSLGNSDEGINSENYFSKILLHQPNALFNYSNLAYQTYFVDQKELNLLDELFYDIHRLGVIKNDIKLAEPVLRNADFVSFNLRAIAQQYSPAHASPSPNGLTSEQACQLSRYAGMNDKLTSFGIYDYNPTLDFRDTTAHLISQMIWYFIEGFYQRKSDFPIASKNSYTKYTVAIDEGKQEIVFYKSPKSDRWWMEVPYHFSMFKKYERHLMLPCQYSDYESALKNELPERWFQTFKKLK